jgi:hypothetical protein
MLTLDNAAEAVERALKRKLPQESWKGRGIVTLAGGHRYRVCAWVMIRALRRIGCTLPIQAWYLGDVEKDTRWEELVRPYGVECIDAFSFRKKHPHPRLNGWEAKTYSILHSPFEEVVFLDADNVPLVDPRKLFSTPEYKETGALFWPDYTRLGPDRTAWKVFGNIPYRDEPEFESGQIVVDKTRCRKELELANWYGEHSDFFYGHVLGDKETFHLAWRKLDTPYSMTTHPIRSLIGTMVQHDFKGKPVFQHRNLEKFILWNNRHVEGFINEPQCLGFLDELRVQWRPWERVGQKRDTPTSAVGHYRYHRLDHDWRPLVLEPHGVVGGGRAGCEMYWYVENEKLFFTTDEGSPTIRMDRSFRGAWVGRWLIGDKVPVVLTPEGIR